MKLNKKHIGQFFDVRGADESWVYQLVDIKDGKLLCRVFSNRYEYEFDTNKYSDWRPFNTNIPHKNEITKGWRTARGPR